MVIGRKSKFTDKDLIIEIVNSFPRDESHNETKQNQKIFKPGFK